MRAPAPIPVLASAAIASSAAATVSALARRYHADRVRALQRLAGVDRRIAQTKAGTIEYATAGDGLPVLEVHGIFGGFDQGLLAAGPVLPDGFRIIAPSRFGYLGTPLPSDASPASQGDAHACLLDHLGLDRVIVMAHSAGSVSTIQLALRHPERVAALVLMVPAAPGPAPTAPPRALVDALFRTDAVFWFLATFVPRALPIGVPAGLTLSAEDRAAIFEMMETLLPATERREGFLFDMFVSTPSMNSGLPLGEVVAPTLVVTAADDPLASPANARRLAALLPNAHLVQVDHGGHLLLGQTAKVSAEVGGFIEQTSVTQHAGR